MVTAFEHGHMDPTTEEQATLALHRIVDSWEALPGGRNYHPLEIEKWLRNHMTPAINHARKVLGRPLYPQIERPKYPNPGVK